MEHLLAHRRHYAIQRPESRLLPFAGQKVIASGTLYKRGSSTAIVMDKIEAQTAASK